MQTQLSSGPTNLSSWTSPSGESYGSPLRSPPVRKEPAERAPTPGAPFLPGSDFPAEHPALPGPGRAGNFSPSLAIARLGWSPRDSAFLQCPRPRASRRRAGRPPPLTRGPEGGEPSARAPPAPAPLPAGGAASRAAPPLAGREPEGLGTPQADLLRLRAARLSSERGSSNLGARSSSGEPSTPLLRPQHPPPAPRLQLSLRPGLAARDGFPSGAVARVLALPAGGRGVRREVSRPPGDPLLLYPALISHRPGVPSLCSRARNGATARPRREESRRAAVSTRGCPRPRGRAPCASGNPGRLRCGVGRRALVGAAGEGRWSPASGL